MISSTRLRIRCPIVWAVCLWLLLAVLGGNHVLIAQKKKTKTTTTTNKVAPAEGSLTKLRNDYIQATKDYKASLDKLRSSYEKSVASAENHVTQSRALYADGIISKTELEQSELQLATIKRKVAEVQTQLEQADTQIANVLIEAETEAKMGTLKRLPKGSLISSTAFIRYNGPASWNLSDAWKVQRFFEDTFKHPLPIGVFGQGVIHDRWRLDHRNAMDLSVNPDGVEGQAIINFLRSNGIPFSAFRQAIPGTATGPHIHVGRPSHRY